MKLKALPTQWGVRGNPVFAAGLLKLMVSAWFCDPPPPHLHMDPLTPSVFVGTTRVCPPTHLCWLCTCMHTAYELLWGTQATPPPSACTPSPKPQPPCPLVVTFHSPWVTCQLQWPRVGLARGGWGPAAGSGWTEVCSTAPWDSLQIPQGLSLSSSLPGGLSVSLVLGGSGSFLSVLAHERGHPCPTTNVPLLVSLCSGKQ